MNQHQIQAANMLRAARRSMQINQDQHDKLEMSLQILIQAIPDEQADVPTAGKCNITQQDVEDTVREGIAKAAPMIINASNTHHD